MTTTAEKSKPHKNETPSHEDVQAAYECHTLALILYGQIAALHPWVVAPPCGSPPMPGPYATDPHLQPMAGPMTAPWAPSWSDIPMHPLQGGLHPTTR